MVSFKVENGESEKITQDAYAHGMNKSEYLRFLVEEEREQMNNAEKKAINCLTGIKSHYVERQDMRKEDEGK